MKQKLSELAGPFDSLIGRLAACSTKESLYQKIRQQCWRRPKPPSLAMSLPRKRRSRIYSDTKGDYTRAYVSADDGDVPGLTVFTRSDGTIRQFWSAEMSAEMADSGQDPRGAPDVDPLWTILDLTPAGRGATWYPKLEYASLTTIE
jgi:predicted dithiol-disulfide oxidoreductase (DUF899 family)